MFVEDDQITITEGRPPLWRVVQLWRWWRRRHSRGTFTIASIEASTIVIGESQ